jgi:hypothetical protein
MKARATAALARLPDGEFIEAMARGLALITEWIESLERWATHLEENHAGGAEVLRVVADEEAAKYLILVDAVRCPRRFQKERVRQLKRCHRHIEKGIYAEACNYSAPTYKELLGYIEHMRLSHYLDGPNDVDWIFRNVVEARREERLYVDYVEGDDGQEWWTPARFDRTPRWSSDSSAVRVARSLTRAGFGDPAGLQIVADIWRTFEVNDETTYTQLLEVINETVQRLQAAGVFQADYGGHDHSVIVDSWQFPLYLADLAEIRVDLEELRERQRNWTPD